MGLFEKTLLTHLGHVKVHMYLIISNYLKIQYDIA